MPSVFYTVVKFLVVALCSQLVGLVQSIIAQKKCPTDLSMEDLYIKRLSGDIPKLQVLILNGRCLLKTGKLYMRGCLALISLHIKIDIKSWFSVFEQIYDETI